MDGDLRGGRTHVLAAGLPGRPLGAAVGTAKDFYRDHDLPARFQLGSAGSSDHLPVMTLNPGSRLGIVVESFIHRRMPITPTLPMATPTKMMTKARTIPTTTAQAARISTNGRRARSQRNGFLPQARLTLRAIAASSAGQGWYWRCWNPWSRPRSHATVALLWSLSSRRSSSPSGNEPGTPTTSIASSTTTAMTSCSSRPTLSTASKSRLVTSVAQKPFVATLVQDFTNSRGSVSPSSRVRLAVDTVVINYRNQDGHRPSEVLRFRDQLVCWGGGAYEPGAALAATASLKA